MSDLKSTTNTYIIEVFCWNTSTNKYEKKDDCLMSLDTFNGDLNVVSSTIKQPDNNSSKANNNNPLCYVSINVIKDNFSIISRKHHKIASMYNTMCGATEVLFEYELQFEGRKFGIRFDQRSAAAEDNFYTEYTKLRSKYQCTEYYASKRIKMEGNKVNNRYDGFCVEYYDLPGSPIKYTGQFEDGKYDGDGDFFSSDGNIKLSCNNICAGKPNRIGRLVIGRNRDTKNITMADFKDLISTDPNYTNDILARVEPDYENLMALLKFESMTLEERSMYLFKEILKLKAAGIAPKQNKPYFSLF